MPWLRNIRGKLSSLLIRGSNRALDGVHLPFLENRLAALATDPGWYGIERQVVSVPVERLIAPLQCRHFMLSSSCAGRSPIHPPREDTP